MWPPLKFRAQSSMTMGAPRWNRRWLVSPLAGWSIASGAPGSAKRYYAVSKEYEKPIAERFQQWPEAAVTYFGILVSPCKVRIEEPDAKVLVVEDRSLGRAAASGRPPFLPVPPRINRTQAQGSFKVMEDESIQASPAAHRHASRRRTDTNQPSDRRPAPDG